MAKKAVKKYSREFGKKERVLNHAAQRYHLSRPPKVGMVMALIRECQPKSFEEWESWYFENAVTQSKSSAKITKETIEELGERLYIKITEIVIPEFMEVFSQLTLQDCVDYIYNLTIHRTYDGFLREKSVMGTKLRKRFPEVRFEESDPHLDHAGDIDHLGWVNNRAFGIQIKPITAKANFGNYSPSDRMRKSFEAFTEKYGGKVFIIYSEKNEIRNNEVLEEIKAEIQRLLENR